MNALPELNTNGIDISNTLLKLKQAKDEREYKNALLQEREEANALKEQDLKVKQIEAQTKLFTHAREGLNWVVANVENGDPTAYDKFREHMTKNMGIPEDSFPAPDTFYDEKEDVSAPGGKTKVFNKERFMKWSSRTMMTADQLMKNNYDHTAFDQKVAYGPGGKTMSVAIKKGEIYDPEEQIGVGWTFNAPEKSKLLSPEEESQQVRIAHAKREPKDRETWSPEQDLGDGRKGQVSNRGKLNVTVTPKKDDKKDNGKEASEIATKIFLNKKNKDLAALAQRHNELNPNNPIVWKEKYGGLSGEWGYSEKAQQGKPQQQKQPEWKKYNK